MVAWYTESRGENIEGKGVSGCLARIFLKHMIGHVLIDMDKMVNLIKQDAHGSLKWQVISFPGMELIFLNKKLTLWSLS